MTIYKNVAYNQNLPKTKVARNNNICKKKDPKQQFVNKLFGMTIFNKWPE